MAISLKVTKEKRRTIAMELTHHVHNKTSKMYSSIPKGMKSSAAFFRYRPTWSLKVTVDKRKQGTLLYTKNEPNLYCHVIE